MGGDYDAWIFFKLLLEMISVEKYKFWKFTPQRIKKFYANYNSFKFQDDYF